MNKYFSVKSKLHRETLLTLTHISSTLRVHRGSWQTDLAEGLGSFSSGKEFGSSTCPASHTQYLRVNKYWVDPINTEGRDMLLWGLQCQSRVLNHQIHIFFTIELVKCAFYWQQYVDGWQWRQPNNNYISMITLYPFILCAVFTACSHIVTFPAFHSSVWGRCRRRSYRHGLITSGLAAQEL